MRMWRDLERERWRRAYGGDELHFCAFDVFNDHNSLFGEVVQGQVIDGVAQDRLLDEQHIAAGFDDGFEQFQNVLALFTQNTVDLLMVLHHNRVLHLCTATHARAGEVP